MCDLVSSLNGLLDIANQIALVLALAGGGMAGVAHATRRNHPPYREDSNQRPDRTR